MTQEQVFGGRYRVIEVLGHGGMARVVKARDERLGRLVAVKTLHTDFDHHPERMARFEKEARFAASLSHPNIIGVYDIDHDQTGAQFIVMEYIEGENLKSLIRREGPLVPAVVVAIIRELCLALDYAHHQGVIHRDIKPENIFLTSSRQVKVGDFGIARALDATGVTTTGQVLGSVWYFSPEQAQSLPVTARSDLYSLGIVLYEMLTRQVPFTADNAVAVAMKHVTEAAAPPSSLNPDLSPGVDAVVLKAIAKQPAQRYSSGAELAGALARAFGGVAAASVTAPAPGVEPSAARVDQSLTLTVTAMPVAATSAHRTVAADQGAAPPRPLVGARGPTPRGAAPLTRWPGRRFAPMLVGILLLAMLTGGLYLGRGILRSLGGAPPAPATAGSGGVAGGAAVTPIDSTTSGGAVAAVTTTSTPPAVTATRPSQQPGVTRTPSPAAVSPPPSMIPPTGRPTALPARAATRTPRPPTATSPPPATATRPPSPTLAPPTASPTSVPSTATPRDVPPTAVPAPISPTAGAGDDVQTQQVRTVVRQANDVYRYTMSSLDTSRLSSTFGPYQTATYENVVADYVAKAQHLEITALAPLVVRQVKFSPPTVAVVTGYTSEKEVLVSPSGQHTIAQGRIYFTDTLWRVDGRWLVESVKTR